MSVYSGKSRIHQRVSTPRQKRQPADVFYTKARVWDDVNSVQSESKKLIESTETIMHSAAAHISDPVFMECIQDKRRVADTITALTNQHVEFKNRFNAVANTHQGKSGRANDQDDNMSALVTTGKYMEVVEYFDVAVKPLVADLTQSLTEAEQRYKKVVEKATSKSGICGEAVLDPRKLRGLTKVVTPVDELPFTAVSEIAPVASKESKE